MSEVAKVFNRVAADYDDWYRQPKGRQVFEAEIHAVESMTPSRGIGLEVGAGTGVFAERFTDEDRMVICLDVSREMLRRAQERGLYTVLGSGAHLPLKSSCLDFVYMITVVEFLGAPGEVFLEIKGVLKPLSSIVVLFINRDSLWGELYLKMAEGGDPVFSHAQVYDEEDVVRMLEGAGFRVDGLVGTLRFGPFEFGDEEPSFERSRMGVIVVRASLISLFD